LAVVFTSESNQDTQDQSPPLPGLPQLSIAHGVLKEGVQVSTKIHRDNLHDSFQFICEMNKASQTLN
jgi:hypothetical protein